MSYWNSISSKIYNDVINPKIPDLVRDLRNEKKKSCHQQLLVLFKDELADLSSWQPSQLIDKFLEGNDKPLLEKLVKYDSKQVAKKIKAIYPEHTEESLSQAINDSLSNLDPIVEREIEKALAQHKEQLKTRLSEREKLEKSFIDLGFASETEEIDLKDACLWVPASFRHDVEKGRSRAVYGGVHILGIARHICPHQMQILARQTRLAGQRLWRNKVWGDAANRYHATLVEQRFSDPQYVVRIDQPTFKTPYGLRRWDVTVFEGKKLIHASEIKTGNAPVQSRQAKADDWMRNKYCPVEFMRYPGCPVNLSEYTNCRVQ